VRRCYHRISKQEFAIKIMKKKEIQKHQVYVELLQNELAILGEKSHPNLIRIIDLMEDEERYYVVSELVKGGELFKRLVKVKCFTEDQACDIILQIMQGLNYMHLQSVTHRDMKPENILLVSDQQDCFDIKIADLGFAQKFDRNTGLDLVLGTPLYMAPELVRGEKYSEKVDVWSLGCITYQLLSGKTPFDGRNLEKINHYICNKPIVFKDKYFRDVSPNAKDFILHCLERDQFKRPSIEDLFDHPWIAELPERQDDVNEKQQLNVQKNLIQYQTCSDF
jgi:serine/threonine protein kinase